MIGARSRFNVPPGTEMPVIVSNQENELVMMTWGLVPLQMRAQTADKPVINAQAEALAEKLSFRRLLASQRCLIPASGFFRLEDRWIA